MEKDTPSNALLVLFELMLLVVVNSFKLVALLATTLYRLWCPESPPDKIETNQSHVDCTKN